VRRIQGLDPVAIRVNPALESGDLLGRYSAARALVRVGRVGKAVEITQRPAESAGAMTCAMCSRRAENHQQGFRFDVHRLREDQLAEVFLQATSRRVRA